MTVPGRGNPNASGLILGEAPGADEERLGLPFVGASGYLLSQALEAAGIDESRLWITNVVKERPPNNRTPTDEEIQAALPDLFEEINRVDPTHILALGNVPLYALTGLRGITKRRGKWLLGDVWILTMPTFHPAYVLRNRTAEDVWRDDIRTFVSAVSQP